MQHTAKELRIRTRRQVRGVGCWRQQMLHVGYTAGAAVVHFTSAVVAGTSHTAVVRFTSAVVSGTSHTAVVHFTSAVVAGTSHTAVVRFTSAVVSGTSHAAVVHFTSAVHHMLLYSRQQLAQSHPPLGPAGSLGSLGWRS
jgi:hypothetical protein